MQDHQTLLLSSFPWLTADEATDVAMRIAPIPGKVDGVADQMRAIAAELEACGLPPTSSLILGLAGRGSKSTAVQIARDVARARFEQARPTSEQSVMPAAALQTTPALDENTIRSIVKDALSQLPAAFGAAPTNNSEVLDRIAALASELRWLKSTIDTERQLRRYQEKHGPLPEPGLPTSTPQERRTVIAQLAGSLERDRFKGQVITTYDAADGTE